MLRYFTALPFAVPALAAGIIVSALVAKRIARRIHERPVLVFLWLASLALVLSATLTPSGHAFGLDEGLRTTRVWTWSLPSPGALSSVNWQSMNILLFAPLGFTSGLFTRRRHIARFGTLALLVSVIVEIVQFTVIPLGRSQFNSATVLIGWAGIAIGLLVGVLLSAVIRRIRLGEPQTREN
ncbi:VanZ family protein [Brevibacterium oceani]|uniref:VanZ family protein n=1 Tax=Brevibacterium oceani TaxID=358099 RepID=UPI001C6280F2